MSPSVTNILVYSSSFGKRPHSQLSASLSRYSEASHVSKASGGGIVFMLQHISNLLDAISAQEFIVKLEEWISIVTKTIRL